MNRYIYSILFLMLIQMQQSLLGQHQCLENLNIANKLLESGKLKECIELAKTCSFQEQEMSIRTNAYRILAISWLQLGLKDSATEAATSMLKLNPTYKPNILKDPAEFIKLLSSIQIIPKFSLGLAFSAGTNFAIPIVQNSYIVANYRKTYTSGNGLQFGTWLGLFINPKVQIELGILSTTKKFNIDYNMDNWKVQVGEKITYLDVPLNLNYFVKINNKISVAASGGIYAGYMLYDQNDFKSTYTPENTSFELYQLNILDRRNRWNYGFTGGLGLQYKVKNGQLLIKADYYHSNVNIVKTENRWNYQDQIYTYFYVDDDIKIQNLSLRLGYTYFLNYQVYQRRKGNNAKI